MTGIGLTFSKYRRKEHIAQAFPGCFLEALFLNLNFSASLSLIKPCYCNGITLPGGPGRACPQKNVCPSASPVAQMYGCRKDLALQPGNTNIALKSQSGQYDCGGLGEILYLHGMLWRWFLGEAWLLLGRGSRGVRGRKLVSETGRNKDEEGCRHEVTRRAGLGKSQVAKREIAEMRPARKGLLFF